VAGARHCFVSGGLFIADVLLRGSAMRRGFEMQLVLFAIVRLFMAGGFLARRGWRLWLINFRR